MMKRILALVVLFGFTGVLQAAIILSVDVSSNSSGQDVYIVTATSDGLPVTSIGFNVISEDGDISQFHPYGLDTPLGDYNFIMLASEVDQDTQAMFATAADTIPAVPTGPDTTSLLDIQFTGFTPFMTRDVLQVVLQPNGGGHATIEVVVGEEQYTIMPPRTQGPNGSVLNLPEPASIGMMVVCGVALMRRR